MRASNGCSPSPAGPVSHGLPSGQEGLPNAARESGPDRPGQAINASEAARAALLILGLTVLSYGPYVPFARFFWDEWNILPLGLEGGAWGMAKGFFSHRALVHSVQALGYGLFGPHPVVWQVACLAIRALAALAGWCLVRHLFPRRRDAALGVAAIMAVFPGYAHTTMGLFAFITYSSLAAATLSHLLTVRAYTCQGTAARAGCFLGALLLAMVVTIGYEAFWGLELFRPLLIFLVVSRQEPRRPLWPRAWRTFKGWLPYLAVTVPYLYWRVFVFKSAKTFVNPADHLGGPGAWALKAAGKTLERLYMALVNAIDLSWTQAFLDLATRSDAPALLTGLALGLVGAGFMALLIGRARPRPAGPAEPSLTARGMLGIGVFTALLATPLAGLLNDSTNLPKAMGLAAALGGLLALTLLAARAEGQANVRQAFVGVGAGLGATLGLILPYRYSGLNPKFLLPFAAACLAVSAGCVFLYRRLSAHPRPLGHTAVAEVEKRREYQILGLGGLALIIVAFSVPVLAGSPGTIGGESRFYPTAFLGIALLLSALLFGLAPRRAALAMLGVLVVLGIATNHLNGAYFKTAGRQVDDLAWQLFWRVPGLPAQGVAAIKTTRHERLTVDSHVSGFLAGLYGRYDLGGVLVRTKKGDARVRAILEGQRYQANFKGLFLEAANPLVLWGPSPGRCLWVIDRDSPLTAQDDRQLFLLKEVANSGLIQKEALGSPPPALFGPEPGHDCWCYYYQKAELARQFQDWPAIVKLWEEVRRRGLKPVDQREWSAFAQGLGQAGRREEAQALTQAMAQAVPGAPDKSLDAN
ncbi:MAG: hypothetical protein HY910_15685 [Desulfarculus sp.]|nr:hypothetical protein [Desulfarculus sp.]